MDTRTSLSMGFWGSNSWPTRSAGIGAQPPSRSLAHFKPCDCLQKPCELPTVASLLVTLPTRCSLAAATTLAALLAFYGSVTVASGHGNTSRSLTAGSAPPSE
ncbi:hypothetical protein LshimejAT787_0308630 [Lyophyllum shimeji]|uniref:Uncharacterized protein n=1 Tax=Lyophyllum shimeji TaxID=47721 RepID=A0A9P3PIH6_LYOSH|nr:hypothetical protein LshimejAT787_0308630 [Lyophyllum shimeji]